MTSRDVITAVRVTPSIQESNQRKLTMASRDAITDVLAILSMLERNQRKLKMTSSDVTTVINITPLYWRAFYVH